MPLTPLLFWLIGFVTAAALAAIFELLTAPDDPLDITDLAYLYRRVDPDQMMELLDSLIDDANLPVLSKSEFYRLQRKRLRRVREYAKRLSHDAVLVYKVAWQEKIWEEQQPEDERDPKKLECFRELIEASLNLRFYALYVLRKIRFWMLIRTHPWCPLPPPRLASLQRSKKLDFVTGYSRYKKAMGNYGLVYGDEIHEALMFLL